MAVSEAVAEFGGTCVQLPLADGGEGTLDVFGGPNRHTEVTGPLGVPEPAGWRLDPDGPAVIETARASGLALAGGAEANDPLTATTRGTGELIAEAIRSGARRIVVGLGGSATTDGGAGALEVLAGLAPLGGPDAAVEVVVCCDVRTRFTQAARVFGPQKGATPAQVAHLTGRLERLQDDYRKRFGVDLGELAGAGAAGGLAGGLAALGARLVPGFEAIADEAGLAGALAGADLVVTGEGLLDAGSFDGKVVGGVAAAAASSRVPVLAVVGAIAPGTPDSVPAISLVDRFGESAAWQSTLDCVRQAVVQHIRNRKDLT